MRKILPRELVLGDRIIDNTERALMGAKPVTIKVEQVSHYACHQRNTHVNNNLCYAYSSPMWVLG